VLVSTQQEGTRTAGGVHDLQPAGFGGGFALQQPAHRLLHNIIHDVAGGVIDSARLAHLGLFLHLRLVTGRQPDDAPQELLVHLPQDFSGQHIPGIGAERGIQPADDLLEHAVIHRQGRGERVGVGGAVLFSAKVKQPRVVALVRQPVKLHQPGVDFTLGGNVFQLVGALNAALLGNPQEEDAVNRHLHGVVQVPLGQAGVAQRQVERQRLAPALNGRQEIIIHIGGAFFAAAGLGVGVKATLQHRLLGKDVVQFIPAGGVIAIVEQHQAVLGGLVGGVGLAAAVVDGKFFKIGQDGERQLGGPGVAAQLEGGGVPLAEVDGGLFGFHEEDPPTAHPEGIIGGAAATLHRQGVLVNHILVGFGVPGAVRHVPAERLEERVNELAAGLGFVIARLAEIGGQGGKVVNQFEDRIGCGHGVLPWVVWVNCTSKLGTGTVPRAPRHKAGIGSAAPCNDAPP